MGQNVSKHAPGAWPADETDPSTPLDHPKPNAPKASGSDIDVNNQNPTMHPGIIRLPFGAKLRVSSRSSDQATQDDEGPAFVKEPVTWPLKGPIIAAKPKVKAVLKVQPSKRKRVSEESEKDDQPAQKRRSVVDQGNKQQAASTDVSDANASSVAATRQAAVYKFKYYADGPDAANPPPPKSNPKPNAEDRKWFEITVKHHNYAERSRRKTFKISVTSSSRLCEVLAEASKRWNCMRPLMWDNEWIEDKTVGDFGITSNDVITPSGKLISRG